MKYIIILGDGMADEPIEALSRKTPLQYAYTPTIDRLAAEGRCGTLKTVPDGFQPGSEIANLSVLGYDLKKVFEGRGSLEAASMGIAIEDDEIALRCNLVCIDNKWNLKNHSAGHISSEEARELIDFLNEHLGNERISFYPGVSYRHLMKIKNASKFVECTPPHDIPGKPFTDYFARPLKPEALRTSQLINKLILRSQELLENHPVNKKRKAEGKDPANSIWPWSAGKRPQMDTMTETYGFNSGSVISAVDLIKGIGVYAGLRVIDVEGATGLHNTNYEGKAAAALNALKTDDFVFLHIEASDEAGHEGNVDLKIRTIEYLDSRIVKPIYDAVSQWDEPVTIAVLPDHPTPCRLKTHTCTPVPFLIWNPQQKPDQVQSFDEFSATEGSYGILKKDEFIRAFFHPSN